MVGGQEITRLLRKWSDGDQQAVDELMPLVYDELHRQAHLRLRRERPGHSFQTTDLIHEAYIKLVNQPGVQWDDRTQFFAFAARVMRNILVDHARSKHRDKRGGDALRISLTDVNSATPEQDLDLVALDQALDRLAKIDERQVRIVELRYFGGMSLEATAGALKISRATAARDWNVARIWLHRELTR
jgi:RNA polymerase sigma factor (TIGR02999 family)